MVTPLWSLGRNGELTLAAPRYTRSVRRWTNSKCRCIESPVVHNPGLRPRPDCAHTGVRTKLLVVIVWIALVVWLGLVAWSLSVVRAAAGADAPAPTRSRTSNSGIPYDARRRVIAVGQAVALAFVLAATVYLSDQSQWMPVSLVGLLALLVLGSDILVLDAKRFRIGGSFTGLVLAMALLGPAPAAVLGLASALVDALRRKVRGTYLLNNLVTYTTFPLLGGIALDALYRQDID